MLFRSMLLIILPIDLVTSALRIDIYSASVSLIVRPMTLIDIAINVLEFALTKRHPVVPVALVDRAIGPLHDSPAMTEVLKPFSLIDSTRSILIGLVVCLLILCIELLALLQSFFRFILREVLSLSLKSWLYFI